MRRLATLLLFVGVAAAQDEFDRVSEWIDSEEFERAYATLQPERAARMEDERHLDLWQRAVRGVARNLQRKGGYGVAIEFLEDHLVTHLLVADYVETCIWAGEERRGLARVRALPQPLRDRSAKAEFQLYWVLREYDALEERALAVNWPAWVEFARRERDQLQRFADRTSRARWVAILATAAILLACFGVDRLLRPRA